MVDIVIPQIVAILQGKESLYSLRLSRDLYVTFYDKANKLYLNHHVAIKTNGVYQAVCHPPKWTRRVH